MSEITLRYNALEVDTYLTLRDKVHWKRLTGEQARLALERSLYVVTAYLDDVCVGMGRLVGDGAVICYVRSCGNLADGRYGNDALPHVCEGTGGVL